MSRRFFKPTIVCDQSADLHINGWDWLYNPSGITVENQTHSFSLWQKFEVSPQLVWFALVIDHGKD
jgi:hypothetical protein